MQNWFEAEGWETRLALIVDDCLHIDLPEIAKTGGGIHCLAHSLERDAA